MNRLMHWIRRWYKPDPEALLREASTRMFGDQEVLVFDRMLTHEEAESIRDHWHRISAIGQRRQFGSNDRRWA